MSARPRWTLQVQRFLADTIMDDPSYGSADDDLLEQIESAVNAILCAKYGHDIELDQCMIPSHAYCLGCNRGVVDINHMAHAQQCSCLDDSDVCCVESCPCPRVSHRRPPTTEGET